MTVFFLESHETDNAQEVFASADESVLVNVVPGGFGLDAGGMDIRLYSCVVYARYEWQRVDDPDTRQFMYEWREEASRYGVTWKQAVAWARDLVEEADDGGGV